MLWIDLRLKFALGSEYRTRLKGDEDVYLNRERLTSIWKGQISERVERLEKGHWQKVGGASAILLVLALLSFASPWVQAHPTLASLLILAGAAGSGLSIYKLAKLTKELRALLNSSQVDRWADHNLREVLGIADQLDLANSIHVSMNDELTKRGEWDALVKQINQRQIEFADRMEAEHRRQALSQEQK